MARILVTGADGFIGSHLTEALVLAGHEVRVLVLYNSFGSWGWLDDSLPEIKRSIEVVAGDIRDPHGVRCAMAGCDVVFHLAALVAIPFSYQSPDAYVDTNVKGTLNVLQAGRLLETPRIVHTSTSEVYGTAQSVPMTEEHRLHAQSPYAATKIAADQLALSFHASFGVPVAIARPFNAYGPRQSARAIIPSVITQAISGRRSIEIGALHPTRDFTFVADTVRGFIAVGRSDAALGQVVNLGSNFEVSIADTVSLIAHAMGVMIEARSDPQRLRPAASEVERLCADNTKAKALTGWEPQHAGREGFMRGLEKTIAWFRDPANLHRYKADVYNI